MKFKIAVLLVLCSPLLHAGKHVERIDDFTGERIKAFITTAEEIKSNRAIYLIQSYNRKTDTVRFVVQTIDGATACDKNYLMLKDSSGVVHKLDADEPEPNRCVVSNLDANLIRKPFKLRIPIFRGAHIDIEIDTTTLDLSKL